MQIFARGAKDPAIQIGFTDITFGAPDASIFNFVKPAGTTVKTQKIPFVEDSHKARRAAADVTHPSSGSTIIGSGWTAVAQMTLSGDQHAIWHNSTARSLGKISTRVDGGWVVSSALLSVEVTDDGRVLVGPVSTADLAKVAASGQAP